ncbi:hypothetical protein N7513_011603 [Neofusicoccum parvum]|uniref:Fungal N-terminal domain-containing protein n=2 Tax=Neofusicoccum parvum TaxID=310453 RepID=R1EUU1_BOTPV|nr:hypothetical protein UCRNP2_1694 [Neofusicoccum parvum UCRNP2]GME28135.1 hypothetical protein N7513_011603 [Neofusicoccum parvum]GME63695.1 hypothetical protein N7513_011603 [Neofusicoccum parvum]
MAEVVGLVASVATLAELGFKIASEIHDYGNADQHLTNIELEVRTMCEIVRDLGKVFKDDDAISTAREILAACEGVLMKMGHAVLKAKKRKTLYLFYRHKLDNLNVDLARLKSTLALMVAIARLKHERTARTNRFLRVAIQIYLRIRKKREGKELKI